MLLIRRPPAASLSRFRKYFQQDLWSVPREFITIPPVLDSLISPPTPNSANSAPFTESTVWNRVGAGWRPLFGSYCELGFSFEWHDFASDDQFDWARSFHPGSVELCLNLDGRAFLADGRSQIEISPQSLAFYREGEQHRFVTVEFSAAFLEQHFREQAADLHPLVRSVVQRESGASQISAAEPMRTGLLHLVESLRNCPVFKPAQEVWFRCKALEIAAHLFFLPATGELWCTRAQRAARDRVQRARTILRERMEQPPSLEELGRLVGCSPFYLSRQFSQETEMTVQQYLRHVRLERAAELLRSGRCNVTEAALAVGYNSLSHFTLAFREKFGCCPGLYPLRTPAQEPP